jgi:hypothetical protein
MEAELLGESQNVDPDVPSQQSHAPVDLFSQVVEDNVPDLNFPSDGISWAMIELGVDEPLPPQETVDEL